MEQKIQELKEWVQNRVEYWEGVIEKTKEYGHLDEGQLISYQRIQQHINTTFGEWVKSE